MSIATILIALVAICVLRSLFSNIPERIRQGEKDGILKGVIVKNFVVKKFKVINAGQQLFIRIHGVSSENMLMNMRLLSAYSDRGRQTHRSEVMRAASGILSLATVRPAPFYTALSVSLSQMEAAYV
ncbi:hypothetical protein I5495_22930 [Citrobacter amalonaticus]|uniref:hypothetical protein n=1 Tax=Citrobacter amalonaticus TaxID=35703 RepID=UPI001908AFB3|nr:hypothetical protein [Citrobacter amalonaticus]MBJ9260190.1 hypothetical protein [Citrobacter amalonaticus]